MKEKNYINKSSDSGSSCSIVIEIQGFVDTTNHEERNFEHAKALVKEDHDPPK